MIRVFFIIFATAIGVLSIVAGMHYKGNVLIYLMFTLLANAMLFNGFRQRSIYFETFVGIFLWLGFWLKFSIRIAFASGFFREPVGVFDGSATAFDHALIVSSCGIAGLLVASQVRARFFIYPNAPSTCASSGLFILYQSCRKCFVGVFLLVVVLVAVSNAWLGIYQRGMVAQTVLPYGLNGVFKWLLQFGLASVAALIVRFEIEMNRNLSLMAVFPAIMESFFSNISLLSRGMILNSSSLAIGGLRMISAMKVRLNFFALSVAVVTFVSLFAVSVVTVNSLRSEMFDPTPPATSTLSTASVIAVAREMSPPLFIDRWVGIEGVMAVSSSEKLGWDLWREAWREKFQEDQFSLYDLRFVSAHYASSSIDKSKNHSVNLPGLIAFLYYPGSLPFLFFTVLFCALIATTLEIATCQFCGQNWILCSLFAEVIAYRYAHFGYVPGQSYLLFGTLILNGFIIFVTDYFLRLYFTGQRQVA